MTHTERVHVYFGLGLILIGVLAAVGERRRGGPAQLISALLVLGIGLALFVPVEEGTLTYREVGWLAVLRSIVPNDPGTWLSQWWTHATAPHVIQHKVGGFLAVLAGVIEVGRARRWWDGTAAGLALPILSVGTGAAFGIHGGTADHLPNPVEQVHHWLLGGGLALAGVLLGLQRTGKLRHPAWRYAWPVLVILVGLQIALFYRLPEASIHLGH